MATRVSIIPVSDSTIPAERPTWKAAELQEVQRTFLSSPGGITEDPTTSSFLAVTELPVPANQVMVAPGVSFIEITKSSETYKVRVQNFDNEDLTIQPNVSGLTRIDLVCIRVDVVTDADSSAGNVGIFEVIEGIPNASPVPPETPENAIALANVNVANGQTVFLNADITDVRERVLINKDFLGLTKNDVGLSNVENYGIASQLEAEEGLVNDKYMTPIRTKQSIDNTVGEIGLGETNAISRKDLLSGQAVGIDTGGQIQEAFSRTLKETSPIVGDQILITTDRHSIKEVAPMSFLYFPRTGTSAYIYNKERNQIELNLANLTTTTVLQADGNRVAIGGDNEFAYTYIIPGAGGSADELVLRTFRVDPDTKIISQLDEVTGITIATDDLSNCCIEAIDTTKYLGIFFNSTTDILYGIVFSGTDTITNGSLYQIATRNAIRCECEKMGTDKMITVYKEGANVFAKIIDVSGTVITAGVEFNLGVSAVSPSSSLFVSMLKVKKIDDTHALVLYIEDASNDLKACVLTISGSTITGVSTPITVASNDNTLSIGDLIPVKTRYGTNFEDQFYSIITVDTGPQYRIVLNKITIDFSDYSLSAGDEFQAPIINLGGIGDSLNETAFCDDGMILFRYNPSNVTPAATRLLDYNEFRSDNFAGFLKEDVNATENGVFLISGRVSQDQSVLSVGEKYWVRKEGNSGELTLESGDETNYAGVAKSSTDLIIK